MKKLTLSSFLENFIILIVIFNTIILAFDGLFSSPSLITLFQSLNLLFTIIFSIEMLLKILSFSFRGYLRDKINIFDGFIVILSLCEVIFIDNSNAFLTIQVLRIFRVLRIVRLLRSLKFMSMIINVLLKTMTSFIYIAALLVIFLFIYALLGMNLFGGEFEFKEKVYRQNFDSYNEAFLSVFQIMSRSYYFYFLYLMFRTNINYFISAFYLISWVFVGNFVLLNLFLAILMNGFMQTDLENHENSLDLLEEKDFSLEKEVKNPVEKRLVSYHSIQPFHLDGDDKTKDLEALFNENACEFSFYLIPKANKLRILCFRITRSSKFDHLILFLIILNTIKMIIDTYIEENHFSLIIDEILSFAFLLESLIKSIALGFCIEKSTYLRDYWNMWDFLIVVTSLVDVFTTDFTMPVIKVFRMLRTLRPLRFVSHNVNMKIVVNSLLNSVTSIINVIIVIFIVWLMFGVLGVSLLKDRMGFCEIEEKYGVNKETVNFKSNFF